jgi:hypothetical protein
LQAQPAPWLYSVNRSGERWSMSVLSIAAAGMLTAAYTPPD